MKKKLSLLMAGLLLTIGMVNVTNAYVEDSSMESSNEIIYDGNLTYFELKGIIVDNFLYAYDLAAHHMAIQEAEDIYEKSSFEELEKAYKAADDRLNSITGKENELQMLECLTMTMDITRSISYLIVKGE